MKSENVLWTMTGNTDGELRKCLNSIKDQEYTEKMMEFWQGFPKVDPNYGLYFLVRIPCRWTREPDEISLIRRFRETSKHVILRYFIELLSRYN